jgi:hypothetical protein
MSKLTNADALQMALEQKGRNGRIADYFHAMEQVADLLTPPIDERTMIHCLWSGLSEPLETQVANSFEGGVIQQHTNNFRGGTSNPRPLPVHPLASSVASLLVLEATMVVLLLLMAELNLHLL